MNVVLLVGFMGAGKTSVGQALAARLNWRFYDLDQEIERRAGCNITQIFREFGEPEFRRRETECLREILQLTPERAVIALGGGALARPENEALLDLAHTVFLQAPVEELWRRCQEHSTERPLRRDLHQFRALYQSRQSAYSKAAMTVQTAGKTVEQVADEVTRRAGLKGSAKEK
jgi:shikimate kinase